MKINPNLHANHPHLHANHHPEHKPNIPNEVVQESIIKRQKNIVEKILKKLAKISKYVILFHNYYLKLLYLIILNASRQDLFLL